MTIIAEVIDEKPPMGQAETYRKNAGSEFMPQSCDVPGHKPCARCCDDEFCKWLRAVQQ